MRALLIGALLSGICSAQVKWNNQGLVVTGTATLSPASHLEIWLSLADEIKMPPVSWSGDSATDEASNSEWFQAQRLYREKVKALFTRMWRVAPGMKQEIYATAAFESLTVPEQAAAVILRPAGAPSAKFNGGSYEIQLPWEALPPIDKLRLESVRFAVKVVEGEQQTERPELAAVALNPALELNFTQCHKALESNSGGTAYAFAASSSSAERAFSFQNELYCCGNLGAPDNAISPRVSPVEIFTQHLGLTEMLCGSPVSYRKGKTTTGSKLEMVPGSAFEALEPRPQNLPSHRLADGTRLFRDGPLWAARMQTSGQCATCPWARLLIFALTAAGEITPALELTERLDDFEYEVEISPDWRTVTEFKKREEVWSSKSYCLRGIEYQACGEKPHAAAPKRGLLGTPVE